MYLPFAVAHFPGESEEGVHGIRASREDEYERCGGAHIGIQSVQVNRRALHKRLAEVIAHKIHSSKHNLWNNNMSPFYSTVKLSYHVFSMVLGESLRSSKKNREEEEKFC